MCTGYCMIRGKLSSKLDASLGTVFVLCCLPARCSAVSRVTSGNGTKHGLRTAVSSHGSVDTARMCASSLYRSRDPCVWRSRPLFLFSIVLFFILLLSLLLTACGLVLKAPGYRPRGPVFDSRHYQMEMQQDESGNACSTRGSHATYTECK
jgi:hypothetical protein